MNIVVAGASGFVGRALIPELLKRFPQARITCLSRSKHEGADAREEWRSKQDGADARVEWRSCDLFSLKSLEESTPQSVDIGIYLVHSMGPTAHLDQGHFADYDLILADNFARTMRQRSVRQVIYLGGLIPLGANLSVHLESRREVEDVFHLHQLPTTILRAGLIMGEKGSSYQIMLKLVRRLPVMLCPAWTQTKTTPVDLATVIHALGKVTNDPQHINTIYDLASCQPISYVDMMRQTARQMGVRRYFITVPWLTPWLSKLWVSLVTNTPRELVYPLVDSLSHEMVARPTHAIDPKPPITQFSELLNRASVKTRARRQPFRIQQNTVRSVQRLPLPQSKTALWVKEDYIAWLPRFLRPWIVVRVDGARVTFSLLRAPWVFLELRNLGCSQDDFEELQIVGGLLVAASNRGRLEFREVLGGRHVLAAIHDYQPSLPWFVYIYTQAKLHLWVMRAFAKHLARIN